jgi:hypothetical protein
MTSSNGRRARLKKLIDQRRHTSNEKVRDQVQFGFRLERVVQFHDEGVLHSLQNGPFIFGVHLLVAFLDLVFAQDLHRVQLARFYMLHQHDLPERPSSNNLH